jgi:putative SOS response-associated peptidase YedK
MCGRFYVEADDIEIQSILREITDRDHKRNEPEIKTGEVFPTDNSLVLIKERVTVMQWGFQGIEGKGKIINARSETAADKPTFRSHLHAHRCLIPAIFYYEWLTAGKQKTRHIMRNENGDTLFMAGLYRMENAKAAPVYVILTRSAAPQIAHIHNRMPLILGKDAQAEWLSDHMDFENILHRAFTRIEGIPQADAQLSMDI